MQAAVVVPGGVVMFRSTIADKYLPTAWDLTRCSPKALAAGAAREQHLAGLLQSPAALPEVERGSAAL